MSGLIELIIIALFYLLITSKKGLKQEKNQKIKDKKNLNEQKPLAVNLEKKNRFFLTPKKESIVQQVDFSSFSLDIKNPSIHSKNPRVKKILKQVPYLKHLVVYQEILGPPKSLREDE